MIQYLILGVVFIKKVRIYIGYFKKIPLNIRIFIEVFFLIGYNISILGKVCEDLQAMVSAVEVQNLSKSFGSVQANKNINLDVRFGEILALLGENGSGKTTLMNMLSGIYKPDSGNIKIKGKAVNISSPAESISLGVGMIHQHFKLVEIMSARENISLGKSKFIKLDIDKINTEYGFNINLEKKIYDMSVSEKQTVEILKVLARGADILILDEPTAVLTPQETLRLFDILRNMKKNGKSIVIITHKLNEVMAISDRITILRKGQSIDTVDTIDVNPKRLTELMVGSSVDLSMKQSHRQVGEVLLDVHKLTVKNEDGVKKLNKVSFQLHDSEILGVAGVAGSGQKELCEAIAGLQAVDGGSILLDGKRIEGISPREIIERGVSMSFIPEDRLGMGLVGTMDLVDNVMLKSYTKQKGFFLSRKKPEKTTYRIIEKLNISTPSPYVEVKRLSGGNVQKVLLGREIHGAPRVLITAYPVRGLDINSSMMIYDMLVEQKNRGVGVLYIGEDLDALIELCDRILVLCDGKLMTVLNAKETTKEEIGLYMTNANEVKQNA